MLCNLCPRKCNIDRSKALGFCGESEVMRIARIAPHFFEEPVISGTRGSGTVFFSGCSMGCIFCQNRDISRRGGIGSPISADELYEKMLELADMGVHNINLVTATHFLNQLIPVLQKAKAKNELKIPFVYNSSGYENVDTLKRLDGLIDIYLPDLKYFSEELAIKYSSAPNYRETATKAISEMIRQRGTYRYNENDPSLLQSGVVVRHLVLPSHRKDSIDVLNELARTVDPNNILLSLMSQYTPDFALDTSYKNLHRKVTSFEYNSVCDVALTLGFDGFMQDKNSAISDYTPDFK